MTEIGVDPTNPAADPMWPAAVPAVPPPGYRPVEMTETREELVVEMRNGKRLLTCPFCPVQTTSPSWLQTHIGTEHPDLIEPIPSGHRRRDNGWLERLLGFELDYTPVRSAVKNKKKAAKAATVKAAAPKPPEKPRGIEFDPFVESVLGIVFPSGQIPLRAFDVVIAWRAATAALLQAASDA